MPVHITFIAAKSQGSASGAINMRVRESASTFPYTTTGRFDPNECVLVVNTETTPVAVAWGPTPDADTLIETSASTAGLVIQPGATSVPLFGNPGDRINVKAAT